MYTNLQKIIEKLWSTTVPDEVSLAALSEVLELLSTGKIRVAEKTTGQWMVNQWIKKAILLSFKYGQNQVVSAAGCNYYDKVPLKTANWQEEDFKKAQFRLVPGAQVRHGAYIGKNVVVMPSFVNIGAFVDDGTMVDSRVLIGSCAQIGKNCHISDGVGIGGVLEPLQSEPVIIEDDVFIGACSEIVEGVRVEQGAVLSMGVHLGASTKIYNRQTGEVIYGRVPAYSVVVPGTLPSSDGKTHLYAAIIVKTVDAKTRAKVQLNELLRD